MTVQHVYTAITAVMASIAKEGIAKDRKNAQQGYNFRGIDDVYNALAPILAAESLIILPRVLSREITERTTQKGGALFYVVVEVEFDLISGKDGSKHTIKTYGEAMDSADKATNKAMSAAYKYAAMQAFCIPTEGDNDADAVTPEPVKPTPSKAHGEAIRTISAFIDTKALGDWWNAQKAGIKPMVSEAEYADIIAAVKAKKADIEALQANPFGEAA